MKKKIRYLIILSLEWVSFIVIALIFKLETQNSIYGSVCVVVGFSTLIVFVLDIIKNHKTRLSGVLIPWFKFPVMLFLYIVLFVLFIGIVFACIMPFFTV